MSSCCGDKRNALNQRRQNAPAAAPRGASQAKASTLASIPGQPARPGEARGNAAIRAFLARKARSGK